MTQMHPEALKRKLEFTKKRLLLAGELRRIRRALAYLRRLSEDA